MGETTTKRTDERRKEIISGKVVMMSPARLDHLQVSGNLYHFFRDYLGGKTCRVFPDGAKLYLSERNQLMPDLMIVCDPAKIGETKIIGAPDLVVEILSRSTANNDRIHKKKIYEEFGIKEYWIIDVENRSVEIYLLQDGALKPDIIYFHPIYTPEEMENTDDMDCPEFPVSEFRCSLFPDLPIPLDMIFEQVRK